ncbi:MAG: hypothetical protein WAK93_03270 [Solirubrobacteraceae bacterium]
MPAPGFELAFDDELGAAELELAVELEELLDELPHAASTTAATTAVRAPRMRAM